MQKQQKRKNKISNEPELDARNARMQEIHLNFVGISRDFVLKPIIEKMI